VKDRGQSEDFVILACTVLIQITSVTDRQTDGRTDGSKRKVHWRLSHLCFRVKVV